MKAPAKILFVSLALAVALPIVAWTGTWLYWHLTLRSALQDFEDRAAEVPRPWDPLSDSEAFHTMRSSGCRSLPYLVRGIESSNNPEYQLGLTRLVFFAATKAETPEANENLRHIFLLSLEDTPEEHREKCEAIRRWWHEHGHHYHQWWRIWSSRCGSK